MLTASPRIILSFSVCRLSSSGSAVCIRLVARIALLGERMLRGSNMTTVVGVILFAATVILLHDHTHTHTHPHSTNGSTKLWIMSSASHAEFIYFILRELSISLSLPFSPLSFFGCRILWMVGYYSSLENGCNAGGERSLNFVKRSSTSLSWPFSIWKRIKYSKWRKQQRRIGVAVLKIEYVLVELSRRLQRTFVNDIHVSFSISLRNKRPAILSDIWIVSGRASAENAFVFY